MPPQFSSPSMARRLRPLRGRRRRPGSSFALSSAPLRGLAGPGGRFATLRYAASMRLRCGRHRAAAGVLLRGILAPQFCLILFSASGGPFSVPAEVSSRTFASGGPSGGPTQCVGSQLRLRLGPVFPTFDANSQSLTPPYGISLVVPTVMGGNLREAPRMPSGCFGMVF